MVRPKFDWQTRFEHGGKTVYVNGSVLGASGESMIRGAVRENNLGRAEIALLGNTVKIVKVDGEMKFNRDRGQRGEDIPSWYDSERGETTAERLLQHIVTKVAPHLSDQYEEAFGLYYLGESGEDDFDSDASGETATNGSKPTARTPVAPTTSPKGEAS